MKRGSGTVSGAIANLAAQGIPFLLLLLVTPTLLRTLGREAYGALVLFNLVPQIAGQLDLGLVTAATRAFGTYAARPDRASAARVRMEAALLLAVWGTLLGAILFATREPIAASLRLEDITAGRPALFAIAAASVPLAMLNGASLVPFRALERYRDVAVVQSTAGILYWVVCTILATRGVDLPWLVLLGTVIVACSTIVFWARGIGVLHTVETTGATTDRPRTLALRQHFSTGGWTFVAQTSSLVTFHADKLLVSALVSPAAAGAYAICVNVANKILLVVAAAATYTFPRAARSHERGDQAEVARTYVRATRVVTLLAVAGATPLAALAPAFLGIWIDEAFAAAYAPALQLLVAAYAITASAVVASNVAIGLGEARQPAFFALVGGVVTLAGVALLAPRHGATGAALAALLGMTQAAIFNARVARRLGHGAASASGLLFFRLLLIATPVYLVETVLRPHVTGWFSLLAALAGGAVAFVMLWLATFGRAQEIPLLVQLFAGARRARDGH